MFASRYTFPTLQRVRRLGLRGDERGLSIVPKGRPALPPSERVHAQSAVIPLSSAKQFLVVEWTDQRCELHLVDW